MTTDGTAPEPSMTLDQVIASLGLPNWVKRKLAFLRATYPHSSWLVSKAHDADCGSRKRRPRPCSCDPQVEIEPADIRFTTGMAVN